MNWTWNGDTVLTVVLNSEFERLRPQDFPGLVSNRDYDPETWSVNFESQAFAKLGFSAGLEAGTAINQQTDKP